MFQQKLTGYLTKYTGQYMLKIHLFKIIDLQSGLKQPQRLAMNCNLKNKLGFMRSTIVKYNEYNVV